VARVSIRQSLISATICIMVPAGYVFGADHGWWGDQPATCQAPGAQTTATAPLRVTTAASVGMTTGEWLRKVDGPRPTKAQMYTAADHVAEGIAAYALAFKAAARNQRQSEYVEKYQQRMYANKLKHLPTNASTCSPCPTAQPNGQPLTVANKATGEALARQAASAAGFRGQALEEAVAVARAESTFNPAAANPTSSARGMWQIMLTAHPGDPDISRWADPYASARMAWRISKGGTDWSPWSVWPSVRGTVGAVQPVGADSYTCTLAPSTYKTGAGVAWGGYQNGRVPLTALAHPAQAPTAWFRPDAAAAFDRLSTAYAARFGHPLKVTDSYRDYAHQVSTKAAKGYLAAKPGTSNHGWGLAADLAIGGFGSADYEWVKANGPAYGWRCPAWAQQGGSKPESWHVEYTPPGAAA
jgi:rubrerythrin